LSLFNRISDLIDHSQKQVVHYANASVTMLFWQVGKMINDEVLQNKRADYGKQVVEHISSELEQKYGKNFNIKNVRRMMQFAEVFPDFEIVVPLARQLSWSHFLIFISISSI
jgi:hypothetical protein